MVLSLRISNGSGKVGATIDYGRANGGAGELSDRLDEPERWECAIQHRHAAIKLARDSVLQMCGADLIEHRRVGLQAT
jgi:hypothetical protein